VHVQREPAPIRAPWSCFCGQTGNKISAGSINWCAGGCWLTWALLHLKEAMSHCIASCRLCRSSTSSLH
jgi:hypothetical protein